MTSATAILSIFDLYRRTFGDSHVVLSVAYGIYTAASIFLLEIQALKYAAAGTLDKLKFCIYALERVKVSSPGTTTHSINTHIQQTNTASSDQHCPQSYLPRSPKTSN
jgi:hypothetical protein